VFDCIKDENKWKSVFSVPASKKQIKMSAGVVEQIFKEFKFRTLSKTSSKNQLYKSIINTAFKANIICTRISETKDVSYFLNEEMEPWLPQLEELCMNFLKEPTKKLEAQLFIEDDQICVDEEGGGDY
jgi:hypothetical protein